MGTSFGTCVGVVGVVDVGWLTQGLLQYGVDQLEASLDGDGGLPGMEGFRVFLHKLGFFAGGSPAAAPLPIVSFSPHL